MADLAPSPRRLPMGSMNRRASGWWGMWCLIATEAALFSYLLFTYFYLASQARGPWTPALPKLTLALPNTAILIASSIVLYWGETGIRKGKRGRLTLSLFLTLVLGSAFAGIQRMEWHNKNFVLSDNAYASIYYVTTGFHMAHVAAGLLVLVAVLLWASLGKFGPERHAAVTIGALYWHFVDVVWLAVFTTFYLVPYLH